MKTTILILALALTGCVNVSPEVEVDELSVVIELFPDGLVTRIAPGEFIARDADDSVWIARMIDGKAELELLIGEIKSDG